MKRSIASWTSQAAMVMAAGLLAGCSQPAAPAAEAPRDSSGWVAPPELDSVVSSRGGLVIKGHVAPLGRVVLTDPVAGAYAVGADEKGRFQLRAPRPARDTLFSLETRVGQVSYPAPERLLVAGAVNGPIALLAAGSATRRLDPAPALDAVDTDGRAAFVSGRANPTSVVQLDAGGPIRATAGPDGRWVASTTAAGGAGTISAGGVSFQPVLSGATATGVLERAGAGWRISWEGGGGGRQTTWFPDEPR